jgi:hypothetical protein
MVLTGAGTRTAHCARSVNADVGDQVDQLADPGLVQSRTGVVLRQYALEHRIVPLDRRRVSARHAGSAATSSVNSRT